MEHQGLQDSLDRKDPLVEWACQEHLGRRACLASPAHRASPVYLERKGPKERRGRRVCRASGFLGGLETRETRGRRDSQDSLERRERRAARGSQACRGLQAPRGLQGTLAIQEALGCPGRKETKAFQDWTASLVSKEKQVSLERLAPQAQLDRKGSRAVTEFQDQQERRVNQVNQEEDSQGFQGAKATKVQRAKWVSLD